VFSIEDVSLQKKWEDNIRELLAREVELSRLRSLVLSVVSHEFRTPLAVITTSTGLLRLYGERLTAEKRMQRLEQIEAQVRRLTRLLDEVAYISREQMGERELETGPGRIKILHPSPRSSGEQEQNRFSNVWISAQDEATLRENVKQLAVHVPRALQETMIALVMQDPQPTYLYDAQATEARRQAAYEQQPPVEVTSAADTVLVPAGTKVSEGELQLLRALVVEGPDDLFFSHRGGDGGRQVAYLGLRRRGHGDGPAGPGEGGVDPGDPR